MNKLDKITRLLFYIWVTIILIFISKTAYAYIGPGAGLGALGALVGLLVGIFVAVFVIFSWPIRKLIRLMKSKFFAKASE